MRAMIGHHDESLTYFTDVGVSLAFQDGPTKQYGVNGTSVEDVIQILVDRLNSLNSIQDYKYACRENSLAIIHLEEALHWLQTRTAKRIDRGVEGTSTP